LKQQIEKQKKLVEKMAAKTPRKAGYYMPAEWQTHEGNWLQWPQNKLYSRYELKLEGIWLAMVDALHEHENVHLIVSDERQHSVLGRQLCSRSLRAAN
jgi:agmatine/peptidylarginine deiminase